MPVADVTVVVLYNDNSTETFVVAGADVATLIKGDIVVKLHGKKDGEATAKDYEITRANVKRISYS